MGSRSLVQTMALCVSVRAGFGAFLKGDHVPSRCNVAEQCGAMRWTSNFQDAMYLVVFFAASDLRAVLFGVPFFLHTLHISVTCRSYAGRRSDGSFFKMYVVTLCPEKYDFLDTLVTQLDVGLILLKQRTSTGLRWPSNTCLTSWLIMRSYDVL